MGLALMPTAAIIGGGVNGSGWAARFLIHGWDVAFYDCAPEAEIALNDVLEKARRWVPEIHDVLPLEGSLFVLSSLKEAVSHADWIQESAPERLSVKRAILRDIESFCSPSAIVASSTSGFMPSELQTDTECPERILVAHPYNPVYLLPVVECVGSPQTSSKVLAEAMHVLRHVGMKPISVGAEIPAHIGLSLIHI